MLKSVVQDFTGDGDTQEVRCERASGLSHYVPRDVSVACICGQLLDFEILQVEVSTTQVDHSLLKRVWIKILELGTTLKPLQLFLNNLINLIEVVFILASLFENLLLITKSESFINHLLHHLLLFEEIYVLDLIEISQEISTSHC